MTSAAAVLARAQAAGLVIEADGDRLRLRGPEPPADLLAELRGCKAKVLALLAAPANDPSPAPAPAPAPAPPAGMLPTIEHVMEALAATPGQRITDPARAADYLRAEALRRMEIARLDPMARGLLLGYLRHRQVAP